MKLLKKIVMIVAEDNFEILEDIGWEWQFNDLAEWIFNPPFDIYN